MTTSAASCCIAVSEPSPRQIFFWASHTSPISPVRAVAYWYGLQWSSGKKH